MASEQSGAIKLVARVKAIMFKPRAEWVVVPGLSFLELLGGVGTFTPPWIGLPLLMATRSDQAFAYAALVTAGWLGH